MDSNQAGQAIDQVTAAIMEVAARLPGPERRAFLAAKEAEWQAFKRQVNAAAGRPASENADLGRFRNPDGSLMFPQEGEE